MLAGIPAWSQTQPSQKRLENQIMIGAGLFGETGNRARNVFPGAVLRLSYGLDVKIGDKWSLMPGAGIRAQLGEVNHIGWVGGDPDGMAMADLFCRHVTIWFQKGQRWSSALDLSSHIWFHLIHTTSMPIRMIQGTERKSSNDGISAYSRASCSRVGSIGNGDLKPASACGTCCVSTQNTM